MRGCGRFFISQVCGDGLAGSEVFAAAVHLAQIGGESTDVREILARVGLQVFERQLALTPRYVKRMLQEVLGIDLLVQNFDGRRHMCSILPECGPPLWS